jgi:protein O-GlcNAc transferase
MKPGPTPAEINTLVSLFSSGRYAEAATLAKPLTQRFPRHEFGWKMLATLLSRMGQHAQALEPMQQAAALSPQDAEAHSNLGVTLKALGHLDQAERCFRRALAVASDYTPAHYNLGNLLQARDRLQEARASYRCAIQIAPDHAEAHYNLGNTLQAMGQLQEAMAHYQETLRIRPEHVQAHINFGNAQRDSGRLGDAQASYRLALQIRPDSAAAHSNLGAILHLQGRVVEAESSYRHALRIDPMLAETHANLGNIFRERSCFVEALQCYRQGRIANPGLAIVHSNLASCVAQMSDFCEVVAVSDEALALAPNDEAIWEQRLYNLSYHPDLSAEAIYAEFVRWGDRFPDPVLDFSAHDHTPGRRLRIGYVSPDFRRHTSRFFFWPLFANHDPAAVELVAYSNVAVEDDVTQDFKGLFAHWRNIRGVSDQDVARRVKDDHIDILVDCCNHMRDARLGVFTLKPAPIQATWLGAAWTTGLKAVDYALIDPYMAPEGTLTRETIVRLPHCFVAYRPPEPTPEVAPAPCLKNGFVTFGYSGRSERLNHHTFCVWGEILRQNPSARLILDFRSFADPATQDHYRAFMTRQGLDASRVIMRNSANIFEGLKDFDILLDCFPHSGGTMLFDALWMGVPVLTLAGRPPVGRIGTSLMMNLELPQWVATSHEDYIAKAHTLVQDTPALSELRATMRERLQRSPIMDGVGFARAVEAAYRQMFARWAETSHG